MRKVVVYVAMSLDGYIADKNYSVGFLNGDGSDVDNPGTYTQFYDSIDTVVLGAKTYHQIIDELSPDKWPYDDKVSYVVTHKNIEDKRVNIVNDLDHLIKDLVKKPGKDIWICGGASIINQLLDMKLVDELIVSIMPRTLGEGISLFTKNVNLKLISSVNYNGIVEASYKVDKYL